MKFLLLSLAFISIAAFENGVIADESGGQQCVRPTSPDLSEACKNAMVAACAAVDRCGEVSDDPMVQGVCAANVNQNLPECATPAPKTLGLNGGADSSLPTPPTPQPGGGGSTKSPVTDSNNNKQTTTTPQGTVNGDPSSDISSCKTALSDGQNACDTSQANSFQSQVNSGKSGSYGTTNGTQQVSNVVSNCQSAISNCNSSCGDAASAWQSKCSNGSSCSGTLSSGISQLNQLNGQCNALNSNLQTLQNAGQNAVNSANNNMNPSSNNNNNQPTPMSPSSTASQDCNNPVSKCGVQQQATPTASDASGQPASMKGASAGAGIPNAAGMNVGGSPTIPQGPNFGDPNQNQNQQAAAPGMNPYGQGGSGSGFVPPQNGNNAGAAGLGAPRGMGVASKSNVADILKGERGGGGAGGSGPSRAIASVDPTGTRGRGTGGGGLGLGGGYDEFGHVRGLDLKQYLPGGRQDPTRRISGVNFAHPDIHGANENLWATVTNRFQVHCKLQLLFDCR